MGNRVYNTDMGNFLIVADKFEDLLAAMNRAKEPATDYETLEDAFSAIGFATATAENYDITDVYLSDSNTPDENWTILKTVVAKFVEPGSRLVFFGGADDSVWALSFEKDPDKFGDVQGQEVDVCVVTFMDMYKMLKEIRDWHPQRYLELCEKYAGERLQRKLDGKPEE